MSSIEFYQQQMTPGARRRSEINRRDQLVDRDEQLVDRVLALLRQEWHAGASGSPGFHHQQQALSRAQVAAALDIDFEQGEGDA